MARKEEPKRIISREEYNQPWDSERRVHELNELEARVKGTTLYIPAKLKSDMDETHGGPVTHVKFRTFDTEFRVWLTPCRGNDQEARQLSATSDTQSAAQLGFAIPLRKMGVQIPETRQYVFPVERVPVEGGGAVYEISFKHYEDERRKIDEEAAAAVKEAKAEQAKAKRAQKRAERLARIKGTDTTGPQEPRA